MYKPNLFTWKVHAQRSIYIDTQNTNLTKFHTYRNIYIYICSELLNVYYINNGIVVQLLQFIQEDYGKHLFLNYIFIVHSLFINYVFNYKYVLYMYVYMFM